MSTRSARARRARHTGPAAISVEGELPLVVAEMLGRVAVDVAEDHVTAADRTAGSCVGCVAGVLCRAEYLDGLAAVGFVGASVTFTHEAAPGLHSAIIRAVKPATR